MAKQTKPTLIPEHIDASSSRWASHKLGRNAAMLLRHFTWSTNLKINHPDKYAKYHRGGKVWVENTYEELATKFSGWMSFSSVRRAMGKLEDCGVLQSITGISGGRISKQYTIDPEAYEILMDPRQGVPVHFEQAAHSEHGPCSKWSRTLLKMDNSYYSAKSPTKNLPKNLPKSPLPPPTPSRVVEQKPEAAQNPKEEEGEEKKKVSGGSNTPTPKQVAETPDTASTPHSGTESIKGGEESSQNVSKSPKPAPDPEVAGAAFLALWKNTKRSKLPDAVGLTPSQKQQMAKRLQEQPDMGYWRKVIIRANASEWVTQKMRVRPDIGWVLASPANHIDLMNGKHDNPGICASDIYYELNQKKPKEITEEEKKRRAAEHAKNIEEFYRQKAERRREKKRRQEEIRKKHGNKEFKELVRRRLLTSEDLEFVKKWKLAS